MSSCFIQISMLVLLKLIMNKNLKIEQSECANTLTNMYLSLSHNTHQSDPLAILPKHYTLTWRVLSFHGSELEHIKPTPNRWTGVNGRETCEYPLRRPFIGFRFMRLEHVLYECLSILRLCLNGVIRKCFYMNMKFGNYQTVRSLLPLFRSGRIIKYQVGCQHESRLFHCALTKPVTGIMLSKVFQLHLRSRFSSANITATPKRKNTATTSIDCVHFFTRTIALGFAHFEFAP